MYYIRIQLLDKSDLNNDFYLYNLLYTSLVKKTQDKKSKKSYCAYLYRDMIVLSFRTNNAVTLLRHIENTVKYLSSHVYEVSLYMDKCFIDGRDAIESFITSSDNSTRAKLKNYANKLNIDYDDILFKLGEGWFIIRGKSAHNIGINYLKAFRSLDKISEKFK